MGKQKSGKDHSQIQDNFELRFLSGYDDIYVEAELISQLLDPILHPTGKASICIETDSQIKKGKPQFAIDSFHMSSMQEYVRSQSKILLSLEKALPKDRNQWDPEDESGSRKVELWKAARVTKVVFRRRDFPTPQRIKMLKGICSAREIKEILAASDTPSTRSGFAVELDCKWDDEHSIQANFRNGTLTNVNHE